MIVVVVMLMIATSGHMMMVLNVMNFIFTSDDVKNTNDGYDDNDVDVDD